MKTLIAALLIATAAPLFADETMQAYANNAILNAAESGKKNVTLVFGRASQDEVEALAEDLRNRGYKIDEQAALLNPCVIKVRRLDVARTAKAN
jgi:hypothetical protein